MMQHIATLKPELASKTTLPFEGFHTVADPSVSNRNTSGQDSVKRSAFEDAMERAKDNNSVNNDNQNSVVRDKQYEQAQRRAEERTRADDQAQRTEANNQQQSDKQARLQAEQQNRQDDLAIRQQKEQQNKDTLSYKQAHEQSTRDKHNADTEQAKAAQQTPSDGIETSSSLDTEKLSSTVSAESEGELSDQNIKNDLHLGALGEGSTEGEFDWVEYVNQVRLLDNNEQLSQELKEADLSIPNDLFSKFIADQELTKAKGSTELTTDIDSNIKNDEFTSVTLSQQDLALLLEGQGISVDSDAAIDQEKLAALDKAVANILQQVLDSTDEPKVGTSKALADETIGNQDKLDAELLKAMLSNKEAKLAHIQDGKAKDNGNTVNDLHLAKGVNTDADLAITATDESLINDQLLSSNKPADLAKQAALETSQASLNKQLKQTANAQTQEALLASQAKLESESEQNGAIDGASEQPSLASEFALNKVTQAINVEVPKKTTPKQGVDILAKLPDEKLDAALENINKRVSEIVPELKTETKGSEFVAALQAGVKEVKEQLKQGREPGIDLKTIVADAMVKADVPVVQGQAELKLDKQIAQVSTILGAGTAITQTNTQVINSSLGLGDLNVQKEMSQAQVENAKQLQQPSANDKAINILKPDGQTQLAEKVRWMVNSRSLTAEIRLDPPDLGGMQIKVAMSGDAASVNFTVQSQLARDVLDSASPQLREMLEEQGIELGESNVKQDGQGNQQEELADNGNFGTSSAKGTNSSDNESQNNDLDAQNSIGEQAVVNGRLGGIDHYA